MTNKNFTKVACVPHWPHTVAPVPSISFSLVGSGFLKGSGMCAHKISQPRPRGCQLFFIFLLISCSC